MIETCLGSSKFLKFLISIYIKHKKNDFNDKIQLQNKKKCRNLRNTKNSPICCRNEKMVETPYRAGETKTRYKYSKCKKTRSNIYNSIPNNLRIGWSGFLFLSKNKKSIVASWLEKTRKTCGNYNI